MSITRQYKRHARQNCRAGPKGCPQCAPSEEMVSRVACSCIAGEMPCLACRAWEGRALQRASAPLHELYQADRYATRITVGMCPNHPDTPAAPHRVCCEACLTLYRAVRAAKAQRFPVVPEIRGPRIAHCGTWHPVMVLPWICPACHDTVLTKEALCLTSTP